MNESRALPIPAENHGRGERADAALRASPLPTLVTWTADGAATPPLVPSDSLVELFDLVSPDDFDDLRSFTVDREGPSRIREAAARAIDTESLVIVRGLRLRRRSGRIFTSDLHIRGIVLDGEPVGAVYTLFDRSQDRELIASLRDRASFDPLTGLLRREAMLDRIERDGDVEPGEPSPPGCTAAVFCDVNDLKHVNDTFGHQAGDVLIGAMAGRLRGSIRPGDLVSRWGGDEFVVYARGLPDVDTAVALADRIRERTTGPAVVTGHPVDASLAIGLAVTSDDIEPLALIDIADAAMYRSKHDPAQAVAVTVVPVPRPGSEEGR